MSETAPTFAEKQQEAYFVQQRDSLIESEMLDRLTLVQRHHSAPLAQAPI